MLFDDEIRWLLMGKSMRVVLVDDDVDVKYGIWEAIEREEKRRKCLGSRGWGDLSRLIVQLAVIGSC
jgi:hypothetical protein